MDVTEIYNEVSELRQKELIRLLQLTKDNNSPVIQDLRKRVIEYVNLTEKYISNIEFDNMQLTYNLNQVKDIYEFHLNQIKNVLIGTVNYKKK